MTPSHIQLDKEDISDDVIVSDGIVEEGKLSDQLLPVSR
jgi:hypothetical protein